ncbi:MAG: hypothetical protein ACHQII_04755 [Bacteroidia bacterium]
MFVVVFVLLSFLNAGGTDASFAVKLAGFAVFLSAYNYVSEAWDKH